MGSLEFVFPVFAYQEQQCGELGLLTIKTTLEGGGTQSLQSKTKTQSNVNPSSGNRPILLAIGRPHSNLRKFDTRRGCAIFPLQKLLFKYFYHHRYDDIDIAKVGEELLLNCFKRLEFCLEEPNSTVEKCRLC